MDMSGIRNGMQVIGSDGGMVGTVDSLEGERIRLQRSAPAGGGQHHYIPSVWVTRVDVHVHIDREAALARDEWTTEAGAVGVASAGRPEPTQDSGRSRWVPWTIGLIGLLILLYLAVRAFTYGVDERTDTTQPLPSADSDVTGTGVGNETE